MNKASISWTYGPSGVEVFYGRNDHVGLIYAHKGWAALVGRKKLVLYETCGHDVPRRVAIHFINKYPSRIVEAKPGIGE